LETPGGFNFYQLSECYAEESDRTVKFVVPQKSTSTAGSGILQAGLIHINKLASFFQSDLICCLSGCLLVYDGGEPAIGYR